LQSNEARPSSPLFCAISEGETSVICNHYFGALIETEREREREREKERERERERERKKKKKNVTTTIE
jgi:hypothetical protein